MKVTEHLEKATKPLISVEIIPPKRGSSIQEIYQAIESIKPYDPPFIDVTSHSAEVIWEEMPDGSFQKRVKRKRPGTIGLCAAIKYKFDLDTVPHMLCAGFTREETEDALIDLNYLGIENVLVIRGDEKFKKPVRPERSVNEYACDLVTQIANMNEGHYQDDLINPMKTDFCIGVACYPEKHFESPNSNFDLQVLKDKQNRGAHYAVSQMFFDNNKYLKFKAKAKEFGVDFPILPGLKILTSKQQLSNIPRTFHIDLPEELTQRILACDTKEKVIETGVDWAAKQTIELLEAGEKCVHFYIMQNTRPFLMLMEKLKKYL